MSKKKTARRPKKPGSNLNAVFDAAAIARQMGQRTLGMYPDPAAAAMAAQFGAMTRGMYSGTAGKMKSPARKLSAAEKAARKAVRQARATYLARAARAARLPGKKKRAASKKSKVAPRKKTASRVAAKPASRKSNKKAVPTTNANKVIEKAQKQALVKWLCEGARRSGCGAGGSRVITGSGSFKRIRPLRLMTAGGK